jgi:hypothetical protein
MSIHDRLRTPERIALLSPILRAGIDTEQAGIDALKEAVAAIARAG